MDEYVQLLKILFREFIALWRQVESSAPTFLEDAEELTGKVSDTIGKIKTQVTSSECQSLGKF